MHRGWSSETKRFTRLFTASVHLLIVSVSHDVTTLSSAEINSPLDLIVYFVIETHPELIDWVAIAVATTGFRYF